MHGILAQHYSRRKQIEAPGMIPFVDENLLLCFFDLLKFVLYIKYHVNEHSTEKKS